MVDRGRATYMSVFCCPQCHQKHIGLSFKILPKPIGDMVFVAFCPVEGGGILWDGEDKFSKVYRCVDNDES